MVKPTLQWARFHSFIADANKMNEQLLKDLEQRWQSAYDRCMTAWQLTPCYGAHAGQLSRALEPSHTCGVCGSGVERRAVLRCGVCVGGVCFLL